MLALGALFYYRANIFPSRLSAAASSQTRHSIAVLPFENASNDPNAEYLSEGISEALINSLTELQQLRVIARSTAFHYKGKDVDPRRVGRELQVAAVLTGKVRQMKDALSVQVDLVDTTTGAQLWGEAYDRKISDVVAVKQAIAREVTEKLKLRLSGEEQRRLVQRDSTNAEAYQFYLRGRYLWNKRTPDGLKQAIEQFQQATEHDPNFALGYVGLADSYLLLQQYAGVPSSEFMPKSRAAVDRALQIDDSLAEAHASSALAYQFMWQWAQAEQEYRRAISLNDNYATAHHWFGLYFTVKRQLDDALREIKQAQELDPLSPIINANLAIIFLAKNDPNAAIEQCQRIIQLDPNHISGHDWLGWAYLQQGRLPEAIREREKVAELSQRSGPQLSGVGYLYAVAGRRTEALGILKELEERYAKGEAVGQHLASIYDGLGDPAQAFAWLEKDFQQHSAELQFITFRVQFEHLRRDPRYTSLIRRMGLSP
ncbi:MAG: tetratricopeptide repeat protein [Chthoniobacterales bacterium]|nr:tetratricopeptide repeat protein [Chthoniobacterales bacterium]